jgi:predicted transcriptional regulator
MKVRNWMTEAVATIRPDDVLQTAEEKMKRGRFRRMPVVDENGTLVGILSERDLREHHGYLPVTRVTAAMTEQPVTIEVDAPIETAADLLLQHKIGGLPVVSHEGNLVGIITETDLLSGFLQGMAGGEQASVRIDFEFSSENQKFADAVEAVEKAGGTILGLGTMGSTQEQGRGRTFFLRVCGRDADGIAEALRNASYAVRAVHTPGTP